ncbi:hypothetical protein [Flavobacterium lacus]|uniref:Microcystin-dependent protein n=1 Tax=Flavobacterium lacus TaxID=1353778 RepID=A0A328X0F8_9FLAO|nr:hypothetical protein [Flavobacterium lacus]RAR48898.1 hypothetical protein B0I10_10434 [Flavobacterium lacus]
MARQFIFIFIISICSISIYSQVGINTTAPKSTLDVEGKPGIPTEIDGIKAPNISGNELRDKDAVYGTDQTGVIVYVTSIPSPISIKTIHINEIGYYFFDGTSWKKLSYNSLNEIGDIKSSLKTTDHNGWVLLDGRLVASLSLTQQTNVFSLFGGTTLNLPDASNKIVVQGGTIGTTSTATNITQNQLPNVTLTGFTNFGGGHSHTVDPAPISTSSNGSHTHTHNANRNATDDYYGLVRATALDSGGAASFTTATGLAGYNGRVNAGFNGNPRALSINSGGDHTHTIDIPSTATNTVSDHFHSLLTTSINGGVTQQRLTTDNLPRLNVNMFVYLGL